MCYFEQILEAKHYKTAAGWPLTSHLTNQLDERDMLVVQHDDDEDSENIYKNIKKLDKDYILILNGNQMKPLKIF